MSKTKNRVQLYNLKNKKQVLMGEKAAKLMVVRYPAEFRIIDKTITRQEAIKQGYNMVYAPGYDGDYDCIHIESMEDEELLEWKPLLCEKDPYDANEEKEMVYYHNTDLIVVP